MNRTKLPLRRPLSILAAAVLGLAAAITLASPASAHHSEVAGSAFCDAATGRWDVTWTVNSYAPPDVDRFQLTSVELTPAGTTVTNIAVTDNPDDYPFHTDATLYGHQWVPGDADQATLAVKAKWNNHFEEHKPAKGVVTFTETCEKTAPPPTTPPPAPDVTAPNATYKPACDGSVQVSLINGEDATVPVELTVSAKGFEETHTVPPNSEKSDITVPAGAGAITVTEKGKDAPVTDPFTWAAPEGCGEPALAYASTCDEFLFEVTNPDDGAPITVTFTPSTGEPQTITVAPGEVETVTFPGSEGLTVTPSAEGVEGEPLAWEPEDCEEPPGNGGGGGDLPVTGVAAGGIAGGALLLLATGAALFLVSRRRRTTFTP